MSRSFTMLIGALAILLSFSFAIRAAAQTIGASQPLCAPVYYGSVGPIVFTPQGHIFVMTWQTPDTGRCCYYNIFRSTDNGGSWDKLPNIWGDGALLVPAPNSELYMGVSSDYATGLFRSSDGGNSWDSVAVPHFFNFGFFDQYDVPVITNTGEILLQTLTLTDTIINNANVFLTGLLRSTDDGKSWAWDSIGVLNIRGEYSVSNDVFSQMMVDSSGDIYLMPMDSAMLRSTDGGAHWQQLNLETGPYPSLDVFTASAQYLYASINSVVYRSTDMGSTWTQSPYTFSDPYSVNQLAVAPNGDLYAGVNWLVYRSTDRGDTWAECSDKFGGDSTSSYFAISPNGDVYAGTGSGKILRSTDNGQSWLQMNGHKLVPGALPDCEVTSLAVGKICDRYAGTWYDGVFHSNDSGATWLQLNNGLSDTTIVTLGVSRKGSVLLGTPGGLFRSTDDGTTWAFDTTLADSIFWGCSKLYFQGFDYPEVTSFLFDTSGEIYAGTAAGVFLSTDDGATWNIAVWSRDSQNISTLGFIFCMSFGSEGDAYAGSYDGYIYRSTDRGATWNALTPLPVPFSTCDYCGGREVTGALARASVIIAGSSQGLFRSTDAGATWSAILQAGLDTTYTGVYYLVQDSSGAVYAPTNSGVYASSDFGATWALQPSISQDDPYNLLSRAITCSGGIQSGNVRVFTPLQTATAVRQFAERMPALFNLSQNYPNPFSGTTNVEFRIPNEELVTLNVYNALGEQVATLVHGRQAAGAHTATFDARGLPAGVYFYKLRAGNFFRTGSMAIVK